ncbi:MAG: pyridoxal-phosphate dependent enzyme [Saprospirales bacterium]|nr:MAG: pyridoxal-phosphate dependent enzyme [Saprospirales bacterium]
MLRQFIDTRSPLQWKLVPFEGEKVKIAFKRDDLVNAVFGGNKFRKLKYHPSFSNSSSSRTLVSMGGGYSNLLLALAALAKLSGHSCRFFTTHSAEDTYLMNWCRVLGASFTRASRADFRNWRAVVGTPDFFNERDGKVTWIPEGGGGDWSGRGVGEIIDELAIGPSIDDDVELITGAGTGITAGFLAAKLPPTWSIFIFPAIASSNFSNMLSEKIGKILPGKSRFVIGRLSGDKGIGAVDEEIIRFAHSVFVQTGILLDPFYNGKALYSWLKSGRWKEKSGVLIHSGGVQAWIGLSNMKMDNPLLSELTAEAQRLICADLKKMYD